MQGGVNALADYRLAVIQALGVDAKQDFDAAPGPARPPRWRAIQRSAGGNCSVPQVIEPPGERRATRAGVRVRASAQTSLIAIEAMGWLPSLLMLRPSGAMPQISM